MGIDLQRPTDVKFGKFEFVTTSANGQTFVANTGMARNFYVTCLHSGCVIRLGYPETNGPQEGLQMRLIGAPANTFTVTLEDQFGHPLGAPNTIDANQIAEIYLTERVEIGEDPGDASRWLVQRRNYA